MSWANLTAAQQQHITQTLTPQQLLVLKHRLNNHTWNTIATAMNLDEATIRGHHKRAIRRLANAKKDAA